MSRFAVIGLCAAIGSGCFKPALPQDAVGDATEVDSTQS